ncbi:hypothetical protein [Agromyces larvae]|uniref:Meckel syndrome type 1 protein n=1 Tax=Agromyces larvae TaxID=2929802 RepID=A0ABY4BXC8_9MICO|nr:hypothetical protein [Agromyces larvae]UOE43837.1 hypothetical protein MTO99_16960 [Agromyces larvae]
MRWPWERRAPTADSPSTPASAAAPAPAPGGYSPAGWAFLPPLQRRISDAPPATLRSGWIDRLPTRSLSGSVAELTHLVDASAPAGTVAETPAALGAPVQRAIAADLTLRAPYPRVPARRPAVQRQAADASEPASSAASEPFAGEEPTPDAPPVADAVPAASAAPAVPEAPAAPDPPAAPDAPAVPAASAAGGHPPPSMPVVANTRAGQTDDAVSADAFEADPSSEIAEPPSAPSITPRIDAPRIDAPTTDAPTLASSAPASSPSPGPGAPSPLQRSVPPSAEPRRLGLGAPLPPGTRRPQPVVPVQRAAAAAMPPSASPAGAEHETPAPPGSEPTAPAEPAMPAVSAEHDDAADPRAVSEAAASTPSHGELPLVQRSVESAAVEAHGIEPALAETPGAETPGAEFPPPVTASAPLLSQRRIEPALVAGPGPAAVQRVVPAVVLAPGASAPLLSGSLVSARRGTERRQATQTGSSSAEAGIPAPSAPLQRTTPGSTSTPHAPLPSGSLGAAPGGGERHRATPTEGGGVRGGFSAWVQRVFRPGSASHGDDRAPQFARTATAIGADDAPNDEVATAVPSVPSVPTDAPPASEAWTGVGTGAGADLGASAMSIASRTGGTSPGAYAAPRAVAQRTTAPAGFAAAGPAAPSGPGASTTAGASTGPGASTTPGRSGTRALGRPESVQRLIIPAPRPGPARPMPVAAAPAASATTTADSALVVDASASVQGELEASVSSPVVQRAQATPPTAEASEDAAGETTAAPGLPAASDPAAIETLAARLYGPLVRRLKAELLLDRERRGIRIDGI